MLGYKYLPCNVKTYNCLFWLQSYTEVNDYNEWNNWLALACLECYIFYLGKYDLVFISTRQFSYVVLRLMTTRTYP